MSKNTFPAGHPGRVLDAAFYGFLAGAAVLLALSVVPTAFSTFLIVVGGALAILAAFAFLTKYAVLSLLSPLTATQRRELREEAEESEREVIEAAEEDVVTDESA